MSFQLLSTVENIKKTLAHKRLNVNQCYTRQTLVSKCVFSFPVHLTASDVEIWAQNYIADEKTPLGVWLCVHTVVS